MKTNKISAMLLSAALACTPILTSTAQIAAFAADDAASTTNEDVAVAIPVEVNPDAAVVAADEEPAAQESAPAEEKKDDAQPTTEQKSDEQPTTEAPTEAPTEAATTAPSTTAAPAATTTAKTTFETTKTQSGKTSYTEPDVDKDAAVEDAMSHEDQDMGLEIPAEGVNGGTPKTDPYGYTTLVYADLITDPAAFKAAVEANPNFNPFDDIYRFRVPNPNEGKMLYTPNPRWFINTPAAPCNTDDGESATLTWEPVPGAQGYRYTIRTYVMQPDQDSADYAFTHRHNGVGKMVDVTTVNGNSVSTLLNDDDEFVEAVTQTNHAADNAYENHKFESIFRVKEDITINGRYQEQDATTNYTRKENWLEFNGVDKNLVVGYTYDLEHPHVTVSSTQKVRIEICIQAFKIDNATGEMYNLSDVSEPRVVDLNWVAGESWEGWQGMPDQYEDEYFRAAYHNLDLPKPPSSFTIHWDYVKKPIKDDSAMYKYKEAAESKKGDNNNQIFPMIVQYETITKEMGGFDEEFDLSDCYDEVKKEIHAPDKPALYEIDKDLITEEEVLHLKSVNQAITDDYNRKLKAYNEWKRQKYDPIKEWNDKHKDQINNAWRIAYKEAVYAYSQSQFVENKGYDMRYGLRDLDGNKIPELIISFTKNANKNSYVVLDFQTDRAKLRTVHDKYGTEWYYEDVLGECAHRGRSYKLDYLGPIDQWTPENDLIDPLASTTTSSSSSSSSASSSASSSSSASGSSSNAAATAGTAGAPQTGDAGVAGLVGAAAAAVAAMFGSAKLRRKNK